MKRATTPTKTTKIMQKTRITPRGNIFVLDSRKKRVRTKKKKITVAMSRIYGKNQLLVRVAVLI